MTVLRFVLKRLLAALPIILLLSLVTGKSSPCVPV